MKLKILSLLVIILCLGNFTPVPAQGTAFTYQGELTSGNGAANGNYDFIFSLYNVPTNGTALATVNNITNVFVTNGYFIASIDFGPTIDAGSFWLDIQVRSHNGGVEEPHFNELTPRQPITPAPQAIYAENAAFAGGIISNSNSSPNTFGGPIYASAFFARGGAPGPSGSLTNGFAFSGNGGDDDSGMYSTANGLLQFYVNDIEVMRITNGCVGIGVSAPTSPLHLIGNIQMGPAGVNYASASPEPLLIIRGVIDQNGNIVSGAGFSVNHPSAGQYGISINVPFADVPAFTANAAAPFVVGTGHVTTSSVLVEVYNLSGTLVNEPFQFTVIGAPNTNVSTPPM
jgi:hypothetical protein